MPSTWLETAKKTATTIRRMRPHRALRLAGAVGLALLGCGAGTRAAGSPDANASAGADGAPADVAAVVAPPDGVAPDPRGDLDASPQDGSGNSTAIAAWTDGPGACPAGVPRKDLSTVADLQDATRGEGTFAADAPSTCYFIHNGRYLQAGSTLAMFIKVGGVDAGRRRIFVGESRTGVVVRGRVTIDGSVSHVHLSNLTFDLTGYSQPGSFNTLSMLAGSTDLRIDHIDFTGDCATGANGGHVEVDGSTDVVVEACVIEKFGRCGPLGHQDHGVYLASGSGIIVRNNDIRGNASRGIQLNTNGGDFGTLNDITIELNRIHHNGHADYEDGLVMNATGTGTISHVTIRRNLIYSNYYSGLRQSGAAFQGISIVNNTFANNGIGTTAPGRSEANLDDTGSGANTTYTRNIFAAANLALNNCYDAAPRGYLLTDNVVRGGVPSSGACIQGVVMADPQFADPASDLHPGNAQVRGYGAYAP
jgi:hypothetical protein